MQIKKRLFPYPLLSHDKEISGYGEKSFSLEYEPVENGNFYILKNACIKTDSSTISSLLADGSADAVLIVENPSSIFRESYQIGLEPRNIQLDKKDLSGRTYFSAFCYAKKPFKLSSDEFNDIYKGYEFEIEKYDIVAADDGFNADFTHDEGEDTIVHSIFSIIVGNDLEKGFYVRSDSERKITITLSRPIYEAYRATYQIEDYKKIFFNMLLVPALVQAFSDVLAKMGPDSDFDTLTLSYPWLLSVRKQYLRKTGSELMISVFKERSASEWAQFFLDYPLEDGMQWLFRRMQDNGGNEDE